MLDAMEDSWPVITANHLPCDQKSLLFWEFFELVMRWARAVWEKKGDPNNMGMFTIISQVVNTLAATVKVIDARGVAIPGEE